MSERALVSQGSHLANAYEPFVRDVLARLASNLSSGRLNLRHDPDGSRYVVEAPGHTGRHIVVPCAPEALRAPSTMPARTARGLLSKLIIVSACGKEVHVPKSAILRDYKYKLQAEMMPNVCRGCEFGTCPHGWQTPHPRSVVVLNLRTGSECNNLFGWYVCFSDKVNVLVRIPPQIVNLILKTLRDNSRSSLLTKYEEEDGHVFHELACERFARFRKRAAAAALKEVKRKREDEPAAKDDTPRETCVICLEERPTAYKRCRHNHCGTHVCIKCHCDSRGLCPVCDRSSINADYPCSSCHRLVRLGEYGFPCTGCDTHSLCSHCYTEFSECSACESA